MPRATPAPNLAFEITHTHLSRFLRISGMRLSEFTAKGIIRRGSNEAGQPLGDSYRFDTAVGDYVEYLVRQLHGSGDALQLERARMVAIKGQIANLRLAQLQGELIDSAEAAELYQAIAQRIRNKLTNVFPRLARAAYSSGSVEAALEKAENYLGETVSELSRLQARELLGGRKLRAVKADEDGEREE